MTPERMRASIAELLYPGSLRCAFCKSRDVAAGAHFCGACLDALGAQGARLIDAGAPIDGAVAAHLYAGQAGAIVRAFKYHGISALAREMGADVRRAMVDVNLPRPDLLAFVPMHWARRRMRMFNHAELIAASVAAGMGMRAETLIRRVRPARRQAMLVTPAARAKNVRAAFRATRELGGARVLLIDDVYTTGATARECARALKVGGAGAVYLAVYALGGG
ncbi:MAG: ComF family protein [Christensenellales bacterium]|jgi:ComF family protein